MCGGVEVVICEKTTVRRQAWRCCSGLAAGVRRDPGGEEELVARNKGVQGIEVCNE